jgi:hypothetical protein
MTRPSYRRPLAGVGGRRFVVLACGAALGAALLGGCNLNNAGNGDSQTGTDSTPGPPMPSVQLPNRPELSPPYGVQRRLPVGEAPTQIPPG